VQTQTPLRQTLDHFITYWWLPLGYVALLTGLFWLDDTSTYTKVFYAFVAAPALIAFLVRPSYWRAVVREPIILSFVAVAAWLLISLIWTEADAATGSLAKRPIYVFLIFAACAMIATNNIKLLLRALRLSAMLASLAALTGLAIFLATDQGDRLIGTGALSNPLLSSHVYGFFCAYWIAAWLIDRSRPSWHAIAFACPLLAALLATGSRTPLVALALTGIWMLLIGGRRGLYFLAAAIVTATASILLSPDAILSRGFSFRPELWAEAIRQALQQPWIGHGYETEFSFYIPAIGYPLSDPHNVELAVLLQLGIVGLGLWLIMYAVTFFRCATQRHNGSLQLASSLMVYGLAAGLTEGSNFLSRPNESWFLIWIPLSLIAAISSNLRHKRPQASTISATQLAHWLQNSRVIEEDGHGVKVAELKDGRFLKLFRRRNLFSAALWGASSRRFSDNAQRLRSLGITAPTVEEIVLVPPARLDGVVYRPLPGETLRNRWRVVTDAQRAADIRQFGEFLGTLHQSGIYFRSIHMGNVLMLPDGRLGLIDVSDMSFSLQPLSRWKRQRNLRHMLRYKEDRNFLAAQHAPALLSGYSDRCGIKLASGIKKSLEAKAQAVG